MIIIRNCVIKDIFIGMKLDGYNSVIENNYIISSNSYAITIGNGITSVGRIKMGKNTFKQCSSGIQLDSVDYSLINSNIFSTISNNAININKLYFVEMSNNIFQSINSRCIEGSIFYGGIITNNIFYDIINSAIYLSMVYNSTISNNTCYYCKNQSSFYFTSSKFLTITSNIFEHGYSNRCIDINYSEGILISNNSISLIGATFLYSTGVYIDNSNLCDIMTNIIGYIVDGIEITAGSSNNRVGFNHIFSLTGTDFTDNGTSTVVFGDNTAYGAGWNGDLGTATKDAIYDKIEAIITTISAAQADIDGFPDELKNLDTAEIQQVENIDTTTISAAQWAYIGALTGQPLENVSEDASPELGGDLGLLTYVINSTDGDTLHRFGRAAIGYMEYADFAGFSHRDRAGGTNYALLQDSNGITYLNASSGQTLYFRINNGTIMNMTSAGLQLGSGARITTILDEDNMASDSATAGITQQSVKAYVDARLPVGVVLPYIGTAAPSGYLMCDGSAVSRSTYSDLFGIIGETHGEGDGTTTFNIPDYEGRFLRGVDNGAGRDADSGSRTAMATGGNTGDNVGSVQAESVNEHSHDITKTTGSESNCSGTCNVNVAAVSSYSGNSYTDSTGTDIGNETRPLNAYVNFIIKY